MDSNYRYPAQGELFKYSSVRLKAEEQIGSHRHGCWELSLVLGGTGFRTVGGHREAFGAGDLVLIPPDIDHVWDFDHGTVARNITLQFLPTWVESLPALLPSLTETTEWLRQNSEEAIVFDAASSRQIGAVLKRMERSSEVERTLSVLRVITMLPQAGQSATIKGQSEPVDTQARRREKIRIYIECNSMRHIDIDAAAQHVGLSRTAFCRWFKQTYGQTFVSYLTDQRLNSFREMLRKTDLPIGQICYLAGFGDIPYATRLFRRHEGVSPKEYRERYDMK